jgi:hypothetical protein
VRRDRLLRRGRHRLSRRREEHGGMRPVAGPVRRRRELRRGEQYMSPDTFEPSTVVCRPSGGVCDVAESCTGSAPRVRRTRSSRAARWPSVGRRLRSGRELHRSPPPARRREEHDRLPALRRRLRRRRELRRRRTTRVPPTRRARRTCRASAGVCDVAESCDGVNDDCPADGFQPSSTVCRPARRVRRRRAVHGDGRRVSRRREEHGGLPAGRGDCDVAESCDGVSNTCPPTAS